MSNKRLELVRKLIALTASNEVEEARTAAMQACRIIVEEKFEIMESTTIAVVDSRPKVNPTRWVDPSDAFDSDLGDLFEELMRASRRDPVAEERRQKQNAWEARERDRQYREQIERLRNACAPRSRNPVDEEYKKSTDYRKTAEPKVKPKCPKCGSEFPHHVPDCDSPVWAASTDHPTPQAICGTCGSRLDREGRCRCV